MIAIQLQAVQPSVFVVSTPSSPLYVNVSFLHTSSNLGHSRGSGLSSTEAEWQLQFGEHFCRCPPIPWQGRLSHRSSGFLFHEQLSHLNIHNTTHGCEKCLWGQISFSSYTRPLSRAAASSGWTPLKHCAFYSQTCAYHSLIQSLRPRYWPSCPLYIKHTLT